MASEELKMVKSDPCESGQDTLEVIDGIVMAENSDKKEVITEVKPEPEFLYKDEEDNGDGTLPNLSSVDPIGVAEEDKSKRCQPTRINTLRTNFGSDFAIMSDDSDTGLLSWEDSSDEYQLGESSDDDDYMSDDSIWRKRPLGSKQSSVATKKHKSTANSTAHTTDGKTGKGASGKGETAKVSGTGRTLSVSSDKGEALSAPQRVQLARLVIEKQTILISNLTGTKQAGKEKKAWQEITSKFNAGSPGEETRTLQQLKKTWEDIKQRVKEAELLYLLQKSAGRGPQPILPKLSEDMEIAQSFMTQEKTIRNSSQGNTFGPAASIVNLGTTASEESTSASIMSNGVVEAAQQQQQQEEFQVTLGNLTHMGVELHEVKMRLEDVRMKAEEAKLDAFKKMAAFFEKACESINSVRNSISGETSMAS